MPSDLRAVAKEVLEAAEKATPGEWHRHTYGHASVPKAAVVAQKAVLLGGHTDLTWVHGPGEEDGAAIAMTGNGPKQIENAEFIALTRIAAPQLAEGLLKALEENEKLWEVLKIHWLYDVSTSAYNHGDEWSFVCACEKWAYEKELSDGSPSEGWALYLDHLRAALATEEKP